MAVAAQRVAAAIVDHLSGIEKTLKRQLELAEAPRKNFLSAGTVPGQNTVGTNPISNFVAANPRRRGLNVQNTSAAGGPNITLGLGLTTPQSGAGIVLAPGASWDGRLSGMLWIGTVSVVASAAGASFAWVEAM